ncbi:MAG: hypothetical protein NDJ90_14180 [Oligoflexia bacterium]|nr:hypothetical protein [Oligoflexia bacterium]
MKRSILSVAIILAGLQASAALAGPLPDFEAAPVQLRACDATVSVESYIGPHDTGIYLTVHSGKVQGRFEYAEDSRETMALRNLRMQALVATSKTGERYCYDIRVRPNSSGLARTQFVFDLITFFEN